MQQDLAKKRLGRGLSALIGDLNRPPVASIEKAIGKQNLAEKASDQDLLNQNKENLIAKDNRSETDLSNNNKQFTSYLDVNKINVNPDNPRQSFSEEDLAELANSIKIHGVIQPIVVRVKSNAQFKYELIAGERRLRAVKQAGLTKIPAVIRNIDDKTAMEFALLENIQRADLNPIEEALAFKKLIDLYNYTQQELALAMSKSRSHIANSLRILKLPEKILNYVKTGALSAGHARALVIASDPLALAEKVIKEQLSVRQLELLMQEKAKVKAKDNDDSYKAIEPSISQIEDIIFKNIGFPVVIKYNKKGAGALQIKYKNLNELQEICKKIQKETLI